MNPVANQPILFFQDENDCACTSGQWNHIAFENDQLRWQFELEPCPNATQIMQNPDFASDTGWGTISATISGGEADMSIFGAQVFQTGLSTTNGNWYEITVTVSDANLSAADSTLTITGFDDELEFSAAPGQYVFYSQSISTTVSLLHRFDLNFGASQTLKVSFFGVREVEFPSAEIQDVTGGLLDTVDAFNGGNYATWNYEPSATVINNKTFKIVVSRDCDGNVEEWESEPICLIPEDDCTLQIGICGQNNLWGSRFQPTLRIHGEIKKGISYRYDRNLVETNSGKHTLAYGRRNKVYEMSFDMVPEHIRDYLYWIAMSNLMVVRRGLGEQFQYFAFDEPDDPVFPPAEAELANVRFTFERKEFLEETVFEADCNVVLPPLVIGEQGNIAIQDENDNYLNAQ